MNLKDALNRIKLIFTEEPKVEELAILTSKLEDGTIVSYDKLEKGGIINIVQEDGTLMPLPVGEYKLEDGSILKISVEGVIDSVTAPVETPEVEIEMPVEMAEEVKVEEPITEPIIEAPIVEEYDAKGKIEGLELKLSEYETIFSELVDKFAKSADHIKSLTKRIDTLEKLPGDKPIEMKRQEPQILTKADEWKLKFKKIEGK